MLLIGFLLVINCDNKEAGNTPAADDSDKTKTSLTTVNEPRWVTADVGLRMRSGPGTDYDTLDLIPYTEKVQLLEQEQDSVTIGGVKGKWGKISWNNKQGWVFGGFLSKNEVATVPGDFTERFVWKGSQGNYFSIYYPINRWDADKSYFLLLTNNSAEINFPTMGMGGDCSFDIIASSIKVGRYNNIEVTKDIYQCIDSGCITLIHYYNDSLGLSFAIWSNNNESILTRDITVIEQIAATLEIISEKQAQLYIESIENEEE